MARKKTEEKQISAIKEENKKRIVAKKRTSDLKKAPSVKQTNTKTERSKTSDKKKDAVRKSGVGSTRKKKVVKQNSTGGKTTVKVAPKNKKTTAVQQKKSTTSVSGSSKSSFVPEEKGTKTSTTRVVKSSKAKEKAVKKSRQANSLKKEPKEKKHSPEENVTTTTKIKKIIQKPLGEKSKKKEKKKTAIYISPSQLEQQNKRKFPWELVVGIIILICISFGGVKIYQKYYGKNESVNRTNSYDTLNSVVLDQTDILSGGSSNFKHSKTNSYVKETAKAKLLKVNTSGKIIFEKLYDSKNSSVFNSILVLSDGYLAIGSMMGDSENRNGKQLGLLVKYDKEGEILWEKVYESSGNVQFLKGMLLDDGLLVVGSSLISSNASSKEEKPLDTGALLMKYDLDGNILWQQFYGHSSKAKFNSLAFSDGGIYVVGKNDDDIGVLVRYSMEGNIDWSKEYLYTDDAGLTDIIAKDQALYVVGSKKILPNSLDNTDRKTNNTDALLIKYNSSGDIEYEKFFGGSNQERYSALTTYRNYLFVVGYSNSTDSGLKVFTDGKKKTGILIKYNIDGSIERKATFGGTNNDIMTSVVTDNSNLYMTCFTNSKDGNILTEFDNGRDSFGKLIKVDSRLRTLFVK